ncbi:MAG: hypothetical protein KGI75_30390 [Rhizobiaceae bacterium]|nr:hypothetical protein [Rhizobiaceae bacterium]
MDRYAKIVLTVIATALVVIALQNAITPAQAVSGACGANRYDPCFVTVVGN